MTWDVIGLDSNRPQTATNPNLYPSRFKVCNTDTSSAAPAAQLVWTFGADNNSGPQNIRFQSDTAATTKTVSLGTIAANSCKIASYLIDVDQAKASIGQYRQYSLAASATGATTVNLATRTLWVEALVSQNRNAIISTTWRSLTDGTNPCTSATVCAVKEGQRYQITLTGKTSTSYNQIQQFLTLPDNIMTIDSIKTTFAVPTNTSVNQEYGDGCGWAGPTTTSSGTCDGAPAPQISGGKAGGNPIKTVYTVTINNNASTQTAAPIYPMITDNSGSSFHYNTDASTKEITLTAKKASDLSITKTHANNPTSSAFIQNTTGTTSLGNRYVLTVTNNGPTATTGTITVTDTLPSGLTIPASTLIGSSGATFTNSTAATNGCPVSTAGASPVTSISCSTTTSIASGGTATLTLPINVPSGQAKGQVSNTATVSISTGGTDSVDANTANNTSTDTATIAGPPDADLILTNTHTGNFTRGGTATWSLTLKNDGPQAVNTPQIVDTLPTGITYTGFTGADWSCDPSGQVVTCTYGLSLASGATASTLQISGSVAADAADVVTNSATGTATGTDPNSLNNTNITDKAIVGQADMSLVISHSGSFTVPSSNGTFNFAVSNAGPDPASSPSIVFTLPAKMTYVSVGGASGWSCSGVPSSPTTSQAQVVTCSRSTSIASGATSNVVITVAVDASTADATTFPITGIACSGTVQTATVGTETIYSCPVIGGSGFATYDPDTTFNSAEDSVQAYVGANMGVTITPSSTVNAGTNVIYTVTVSNSGPNAATNPFFLVTLPTGFTCNTGTAGACVGTLSAPYATSGGTPTLNATNFDNNCSTSAQEVICPPSGVTTLASGQSYQATLTAATSTTTTPTGNNTIPVITAADQGDTATANNSASVITTINGGNSAPVVTVTFNGSATTSVNENSTTTYEYEWTATDTGGDTISSFVAGCGDAGTKVGGDTDVSGAIGTATVTKKFSCKFDDGDLTSLVTVTATDNRSLTGTGTNEVTINNVPPTGVISAPSSVLTNNTFTLALNSGADVSNADTTAGFNYEFDCGSGYGDIGTASSTTCTAPSSAGSVTVKARITDKNGESTEYTQSVTVSGPPTADATSATLSHASSAGVDVTLTGQDTTGADLTFSIVSSPAIGTLGSITGTNCTGTTTKTCTATVHYSNPGTDTLGNTSFTYRATRSGPVNSATATATITRTNSAPTATVALSPASPTTSSTLTATATKNDADGDTTTLTYVWKVTRAGNTCTVKTTSGSSGLTDTLDLGAAHSTSSCTGTDPGTLNPSRDDQVAVYVTPNDGHVSGTEVSASKTVANTAPVATDQTNTNKASTNEDVSKTITLAATDPDAEAMTFKVTSLASNGSLYDGPNASGHLITSGEAASGYNVTDASKRVTFVPTANYNNAASAFGPSFTFTVTDPTTASDEGTVQIDVDPVNDAPVAGTATIGSGTPLDLKSISSDVETTDADLTYSLVGTNGGATKGTVVLVGSTVTYTKTLGQTGSDTFTYRVTDRGDPDDCGSVVAGACTATTSTDAVITVNLANSAPTANAQSVSTDEDASKLITLTGSDPDSDALVYRVTSLPSNGKLYKGNSTNALDEITVASSGTPALLTGATVTFVPNANYNNGSGASENTFTFTVTDAVGSNTTSAAATVTIDVDPVNDDPSATDGAITTSSASASINLASISSDFETADGDLAYAIDTNGSKGTATLSGSTLTYNQSPNKSGTDTVVFSITDDGDPDNCGTVVAGACTAAESDTGTITVTLGQTAPTAASQTGGSKVSVNEDASVLITLAATDSENDTITYKITSQPSNGKLYKGASTDSADEITGATSGSPVTLTGATVTFVPTANYNNGSDATGPSFTFTATDAQGSNTASAAATVAIDVNPLNDAPTWDASVGMGAAGTLDLTTVSADIETPDANLTYSIPTNGSKGTASLSGSTLSYSQSPDKNGTDTITVRVTDRGDPDNCGTVVAGACTAASSTDKTVTITLVQTAPTATDQTGGAKIVIDEDDAGELITFAGTDSQSDTLTFKVTTLPSNGKLYVGNATTDEILVGELPATTGSVTFVPTANYNNGSSASGPTFDFTATDALGSNTADTGTVQIDVNPVNDTPTWDATVSMSDTGTLDLKSVSADIETPDANLTYSIVTNGSKGSASLSGSTLSYTKTAGQTGTDSVVVRVTDRGDPDNCGSVVAGACTAVLTADKTVSVSLNNNPPTATVSLNTAAPRTNDTLTATATKNDTDVGDTVTLTFVWTITKGNSTCTVKTTSGSAALTDTLDLSASFTLSSCTGTTLTNTSYNPAKGDQITVTVTPHDGTVSGTAVSASATIANTAPTATNTSGSMAHKASSMNVTLLGFDADGDTITYSKMSDPTKGSVTISSATATYTPSGDNVGSDSFTYKVNDGTADSGTATVSITLTNTAPVVNSISFSPANLTDTTTSVTATPSSTDSDGDTITHTYAWKLRRSGVTCDLAGVTTATISVTVSHARSNCSDGQSYAAVTPTTTDALTVTITPNDGHTSGTALSKTMSNEPPSITVTLSPSDPLTNDNVIATVTSSDPDGDAIDLTYKWQVNGLTLETISHTSVPGTDTDTYELATEGRGDLANFITAKVTAVDNRGGTVTKSQTVQVKNSRPTATNKDVSVAIDSSKVITLLGTDPDDQALEFTITTLPATGSLYVGEGTSGTALTSADLPKRISNFGEKVTFLAGSVQNSTTFNFTVTDTSSPALTSSTAGVVTVGTYEWSTRSTETGTFTAVAPTPDEPVQTGVNVGSNAGLEIIVKDEPLVSGTPGAGEYVISPPAGTALTDIQQELAIVDAGTNNPRTAPVNDPFVVTFTLDRGLVSTDITDLTTIRIYRNGTLVNTCSGALPLASTSDYPCVVDRSRLGSGDVAIRVATIAASQWNFVVPTDNTPPDTSIVAGPSGATNAGSANNVNGGSVQYEYSSNETGSTFQCRLTRDNSGANTVIQDWTACNTTTSGNARVKTYDVSGSSTPDDLYTFKVRATDAAGNVDPTPVRRDVVIDRTAPDVTIDSGPSGTITTATATFTYSSNEVGSTFQCRMDGSAFSACNSGTVTYNNLSSGSHSFTVEGFDTVNNSDAVVRTFTVNVPGSGGGGGVPAPTPSELLPVAEGETDVLIFSPNGDGKLDEVTFTGRVNKPASWKLVFVPSGDPNAPLMTATGSGDAATALWNGTDDEGNPLPDGTYEWVLTGTDEEGNAFEPVSGTVIIDRTPPPITKYDLIDLPGKGKGATIRFHVGEASTVNVAVVCGGETIKEFGPVTISDPDGGDVEFMWPNATDEQIKKLMANKCRVVITAIDKVFNEGQLKPLEQQAARLPGPDVMLYASSETPVRGSLVTLYTRLRHCEGHEGDLIELWRKVGDAFRKIAHTNLDRKCRATFTLPADFDRAEFRTIWPKQDEDHRRGRAEPVTIVPRAKEASDRDRRLPGPRVKLFASDETPLRGDVVLLRTRIGRCAGHQGDRLKLLRKLPGEQRFKQIAVKRVGKRCRAVFKVTADFDRAQYRTVWPQQDPEFRRGRSEPVVIVTRDPEVGGSGAAPIDPALPADQPEPALTPEPSTSKGP